MINLASFVLICGLLVSFFSVTAQAAVEKKTIIYSGTDGTKFEGQLISPKSVKPGAGSVLMIHNWMGVTAETIHQAERFADLGYTVFAADIYGQGLRPKDATEAGTQATRFKKDRKLFRERLNLALTEMKKNKSVEANKIAVIGYCFGGTGALELARSGAAIAAAISFHGGLDSPTPNDGKNIRAHVLALHGAIDPYVSTTDVNAFEDEMKISHVDYQLVKYSDTVHSFTEVGAGTDNSKGAAYNALSDKRSFLATENFLNELVNSAKK